MVAALLLASCAPAVTEEEKDVTPTAPEKEEEQKTEEEKEAEEPVEEKVMVKDSAGNLVEKPQYGGILTFPLDGPTRSFDDNFGSGSRCHVLHYVNEALIGGAWAKSPTGSNECSWFGNRSTWACIEGRIAESWEFPDPDTIVYHIQEGIHWQNKAPMNGRELVAEDVAYNWRRWFNPDTGRFASMSGFLVEAEVPDKYTVIIHGDSNVIGIMGWFLNLSNYMHILPPEVIEEYGDMTYWENVSGAGPFMLTDYVSGSSITLTRNPNYWRDDPLHPDNQLPYLDGVQMLIILDPSTRLAALRTAKIDWATLIGRDEGQMLTQSHPDLKYKFELHPQSNPIFMRTDLEPFSDIRVRKALQMSVDLNTIVKDYYGGAAEAISYPVAPVPDYAAMYTPIEDMPAETREVYTYNPEKAMQLLAEAGYPNGFKTSIVCSADLEEILSIYSSYFAAIGVEMELDVKEYSVWRSIGKAHTHEQMIMDVSSLGLPQEFLDFEVNPDGTLGAENMSIVDDPYINERKTTLFAFENRNDLALQDKMAKEINYRILEQVYTIQNPVPNTFTMWWPWVKGYSGEFNVGHTDKYGFAIYPWIDQDLKKEMGH